MTRATATQRLAIWVLFGGLALGGLAATVLPGARAQTPQPGTVLPGASAQTPQPDTALPVGVHYRAVPDSLKPQLAVSRDKAVELATYHVGSELLKQSPNATVAGQHVLFSDDDWYTEDAAGTKHYVYQDVPAWVITFNSVKYCVGGGPPGNRTDPDCNTEVHVAIDAVTGELLEGYSFR